ncbi:alpha-L-fucosidase [Fulvivirga sp. M361]|uniref:alpha-L-fucosidase n=1 Tax=Fulvivirga sp. M361 TaxID=2594266 RepID=UPI00117ACE02|nr:alpha-L-fucosidase [Fulvivirga sp. M361]TRX51899.1 alpha-L-fucosidase [Fulvivirga sp. M361]
MKRIFITLFFLLPFFQIAAQNYTPTAANLEARKWFEDAKFGLFIHWGVYSVLGDGEWVMNKQNISIDEYEKLPSFFNPVAFDATEWVSMAKRAGMKYITITSRHHDGFSMFDSKVTDYTIINKTPYKKDVLKELSLACEKEGIKLFFYYSLLDWHDDNYFPRGRTGNGIPGRSSSGDWDKYIAFMKAQLTELLTSYGEIGGIWFDGHWDKKTANWHYDEIYELIHDLQPNCLIGNNHHEGVKPGEDFQMFEKDLPGHSKHSFATKSEDIGDLPKEVCETINGSWGFNLKDRKHKSDKELIQYLVKAAGYGSNLLLNVGPMPNGKIQPEHVAALKQVGDWIKTNGKTIYGTEAGPFKPTEQLAATQKGKQLFIHVLDENANVIFIPGFDLPVRSVRFFKTGAKATNQINSFGMLIDIPENEKTPVDTIIEITLK